MANEYFHQLQDMPLQSHFGLKQLQHISMPLTPWIFNDESSYAGDDKTETTIILDHSVLEQYDTLAMDLLLMDRGTELDYFRAGGLLASQEPFHMASEIVMSLTKFPRHKIALTLRLANIRGGA